MPEHTASHTRFFFWPVCVLLYGALYFLLARAAGTGPALAALIAFPSASIAASIGASVGACTSASAIGAQRILSRRISLAWLIPAALLNAFIMLTTVETLSASPLNGVILGAAASAALTRLFSPRFNPPAPLSIDLKAEARRLLRRPAYLAAYWAPAALFFLALVILTYSLYFPMPLFDYWGIVDFFRSSVHDDLGFRELFAIHGGHWHATGYFVSLALAHLTDMNHAAEVSANLALALVGFIGLARIISRLATATETQKAVPWALGVAAFFYFSLDQAENFFTSWQIAVFANGAGAVWCAEALSRDEITLRRTLLAALCAALAIYGFGGGWALLPIGFMLMIANRAHATPEGRRSLAVWGGFTALMIAHFFRGMAALETVHEDSRIKPPGSAAEFVNLIEYVVNFVIAPTTRFSPELIAPMLAVCAVVVAGSLYTLAPSMKDARRLAPSIAPVLALALFAGGAALLSGLGRLDSFGAGQARIFRYITQGNYFWLTVMLLAIFAAAKASGHRRRAFIGFAVAVCIMKAGVVGNVLPQTAETARDLRIVAERLAACPQKPPTPAMRAHFARDYQGIDDLLVTLREERLSLYRKADTAASSGDCEGDAETK